MKTKGEDQKPTEENYEVIKESWQMRFENKEEFYTTWQNSSVVGPNCRETEEGKMKVKWKPKPRSETDRAEDNEEIKERWRMG